MQILNDYYFEMVSVFVIKILIFYIKVSFLFFYGPIIATCSFSISTYPQLLQYKKIIWLLIYSKVVSQRPHIFNTSTSFHVEINFLFY